MGNCCDPKAPKLVTLIVGGSLVGLIGVEQAFLDISTQTLEDGEIAEKLLQLVGRRNYIANGTERDYKIALLAAYKNYLAKSS